MSDYLATRDNGRIYGTLDDALADIARRSFYEDATVTPLADCLGVIVAYYVEDDHGHMTDDWHWSYEDGVLDRDSVSETSRLHEAYEYYDEARHIRYNLPDVVEALEDGHAVTFAYAVVHDDGMTFDEDMQEWFDADGHPGDDIAGWILAANVWRS